jgi:hypothetical protein
MYYSKTLKEQIYLEIGNFALENYSDFLIRDGVCSLSEVSLHRIHKMRLDEILPLAAIAAPVAQAAGAALRVGAQVAGQVGKAAIRGGIQATKFAAKTAMNVGKQVTNMASKGIGYAKDAVKSGINTVTSAVKNVGKSALTKLKSSSFNKVTASLKPMLDDAKKFMSSNKDVCNLIDGIKNASSEENYTEVLKSYSPESLLIVKEFFINKIFSIFSEKGLNFKKDLNDTRNLDALAGLVESGNFDKVIPDQKAELVALCLLCKELIEFAKNNDENDSIENSEDLDKADSIINTSGNAALSSMVSSNNNRGT